MKRLGLALLVVLLLVVVVFPLTSQAQDEMMDKHVCDSTLITLLLIAEGDYGFQSMYDLSTYEKGQYASLFEAMMMAMEDNMGEEAMTEEAMTDDMGEEAMTEEAMTDEMMDMVMLTPGNIEGEDEACTALRTELEAFFYDRWTMMGDESMSDGG